MVKKSIHAPVGPGVAGALPLPELPADTDVVFHVTREGIAWASPAAARLLGLPAEDLVGTSLATFVHPDDLVRLQSRLRKDVLLGQPVGDLAIRARVASGDYETVVVRMTALRDEQGEVTGAVVTWRQAGPTGAASARAFATLAEGTRVLLRSVTEQDLLNDMCEAACGASGYVFAWYGVPLDDEQRSVEVRAVGGDDRGYTKSLKVTWDDGPTGQGPTGRCLRTGQTQLAKDLTNNPHFAPWQDAAADRGVNCCVALPVWSDGRLHGAFMVYAEEPDAFDRGALELLEYLAADIGYGLSRLRAMEELATSEQRYRLLAEHATDVVFLSGTSLQVEWISPSVRAVTGWAPEDLIGQVVARDFLHPDDARRLEQMLADADPEEVLRDRLRVLCADGSYRWMSVSGLGQCG